MGSDCAKESSEHGGESTGWRGSHSKLVCRLWRSSVDDPQLAEIHLSQAAHSKTTILVRISAPNYYAESTETIRIPFESLVPEFDVLPEVVESTGWKMFQVAFGFGFHPRTKNYKVVKIVYCKWGDKSRLGRITHRQSQEYNVKESWTRENVIGGYMPQRLKQVVNPRLRIWKNGCNRRAVRVLCILKNGEVLYLYKNQALVSLHPDCNEFKYLKFPGLPDDFAAIVHVGSLISIDAA
ncbi:F-box protein [Actinidia chinensis var. chinensis]|uniref:F-box protein n=1 Tax=Actinidia chinensis var. chinensis TaxID=1590841 RepID=A0A2R6RIY3_ACTCC|nr:F-box protein [Actinidia chinensis var. chinensis]